jgi:hypothetical protein
MRVGPPAAEVETRCHADQSLGRNGTVGSVVAGPAGFE